MADIIISQNIFFVGCMISIICTSQCVSLSGICGVGQVRRYHNRTPICCYSAECNPGQQFIFCTEDNGHDTCQNCKKGFTHYDNVNTADWRYWSDICQEIEDCTEYSDLVQVEGNCVCDVTRGFYGRDKNNCGADDGKCMKAGHYLSQDGECLPCSSGYYKAENDYSLCIQKTSCTGNQEEDDPGSMTTDRRCRRKTMPAPTHVSISNLTTANPENTHKDTKMQDYEEVKISKDKNNNDTIEYDNPEKKKPDTDQKFSTDHLTILLTIILTGIGALIAGLASFCVYRHCKNRRKGQQCSSTYIVNIENAGYVQVGNQNRIQTSNTEQEDIFNYDSVDDLESDGASHDQDFSQLSESDNSNTIPKVVAMNDNIHDVNLDSPETNPEEFHQESELDGTNPDLDNTDIKCGSDVEPALPNNASPRVGDQNKRKPVASVMPTVRFYDNQNRTPNLSPSTTTTAGQEVAAATNNDNYKFAPSHAERNELVPSQNYEPLPPPDLTHAGDQIGNENNVESETGALAAATTWQSPSAINRSSIQEFPSAINRSLLDYPVTNTARSEQTVASQSSPIPSLHLTRAIPESMESWQNEEQKEDRI